MKNAAKFAVLSTLVLGTAMAQNDPPSRVGRLNYISGAVSFQPGGVDEWVDASVNRPLTTGDHLWTDRDGRAEIHIGSAALRLNSETAFEFLNLDDNNVQIRLAEGSLTVRLRGLGENESFEVDTPNLAFSLLRPGEYRIDADPGTATTTVTVRGGEGEVTGGNQAFTVHAREQAQVSGDDTLSYNLMAAPPLDGWDRWSMSRDQREEHAESARYVSRDMVGYEDLDEYGTWRVVAGYGPVWAPREVEAGWAPYRYGHWVWVDPWGWTWVDDARWGFAPFHYGRWAFVTGGWVWVPGPVGVRPVYAPALVAWVGGPRFNMAVSFGGVAGVAWFPLGPREVYVPAYRTSPAYVNRVNITNTNITNVNVTNINVTNVRYVNREVAGAVTAVPQTALSNAQPVQRAAIAVNQREIANTQVVSAAAVAPRPESVLGRRAGMRAVQPPAAVMSRAVVAKNTPPPPPIPFARRQQALAADPGHPLDPAAMAQMRGREAAPVHPLVRPAMGRNGAQPVLPPQQQQNRPAFVTPGRGQQEPAVQQPAVQQYDRPNGRPRGLEPQQQQRPAIATPNPAQQERPAQQYEPPYTRPRGADPQQQQRPAIATPNPPQQERPAQQYEPPYTPPRGADPQQQQRPAIVTPNPPQQERPAQQSEPPNARPRGAEPQQRQERPVQQYERPAQPARQVEQPPQERRQERQAEPPAGRESKPAPEAKPAPKDKEKKTDEERRRP